MTASARSKWIAIAGAVLLAAIVVVTLVPANLRFRTGLGWEAEHFLAYFAVTSIFCLAWPKRPLVVGLVLTPFACLFEALQGLTPDRTPDLATALAAAAGVLAAALLAKLGMLVRRRLSGRKPSQV